MKGIPSKPAIFFTPKSGRKEEWKESGATFYQQTSIVLLVRVL